MFAVGYPGANMSVFLALQLEIMHLGHLGLLQQNAVNWVETDGYFSCSGGMPEIRVQHGQALLEGEGTGVFQEAP